MGLLELDINHLNLVLNIDWYIAMSLISLLIKHNKFLTSVFTKWLFCITVSVFVKDLEPVWIRSQAHRLYILRKKLLEYPYILAIYTFLSANSGQWLTLSNLTDLSGICAVGPFLFFLQKKIQVIINLVFVKHQSVGLRNINIFQTHCFTFKKVFVVNPSLNKGFLIYKSKKCHNNRWYHFLEGTRIW